MKRVKTVLRQRFGIQDEKQLVPVTEDVEQVICPHYAVELDVTHTARRPLYKEVTVDLKPVEGLENIRAGQCTVCGVMYYGAVKTP